LDFFSVKGVGEMKNLILIFVFCFSAPTNSILIETIKKLGPYSNIFDSAEAGKAFFFPVCKKNKKNINGFVCFFDFFNVNYNSFSFF
jgi:hypothetical protein